MTITIQLAGGGEREIDLDQVTEYGVQNDIVEIPPCFPYREVFIPKYRCTGHRAYIKLQQCPDIEIYITQDSLEKIYKAKRLI